MSSSSGIEYDSLCSFGIHSNCLCIAVFSVWIINKAGGLIYQKDYAGESLAGIQGKYLPVRT
jgi:hypothetical protein